MLDNIINAPWAIQVEKLIELQEIYTRHLKGETDLEAIEARLGRPLENQPQGYDVVDGVAVVPVHGVIAKRINLLHKVSGGASTELVERDVRNALDDDSVHSIVLDIDSPGGTVEGTADLGALIHNSRGRKPITAFSDGVMMSAAYWIGSAADQIYISNPTVGVGSIGVVATHVDYSEADRKAGITRTEITAGKYKRIASQNKPLSTEGQAELQDQVDYLYSIFVETVAEHRGVSVQTVLDDMADGRVFIGQQAIEAGLVDGVSTLDQLIARVSTSGPPAAEASKPLGVRGPATPSRGKETMNDDRGLVEKDFVGLDAYAAECRAKEIWKASAKVRREFLTEAGLVGYCKAVAAGSIRVAAGKE